MVIFHSYVSLTEGISNQFGLCLHPKGQKGQFGNSASLHIHGPSNVFRCFSSCGFPLILTNRSIPATGKLGVFPRVYRSKRYIYRPNSVWPSCINLAKLTASHSPTVFMQSPLQKHEQLSINQPPHAHQPARYS